MPESSKPSLSFSTGTNKLHGVLRADKVRFDTLVSLVQHWADEESRDGVIAQLDALAEAVTSPREGELDALVEHIEAGAAMDDAQVEVGMADLLRMRDELDAVIAETAGRFNSGRSRGASEIKHPSMRATRKHLKANPLPEQGRRTA